MRLGGFQSKSLILKKHNVLLLETLSFSSSLSDSIKALLRCLEFDEDCFAVEDSVLLRFGTEKYLRMSFYNSRYQRIKNWKLRRNLHEKRIRTYHFVTRKEITTYDTIITVLSPSRFPRNTYNQLPRYLVDITKGSISALTHSHRHLTSDF